MPEPYHNPVRWAQLVLRYMNSSCEGTNVVEVQSLALSTRAPPLALGQSVRSVGI